MGKTHYQTGLSFSNYERITKEISKIPVHSQNAIEKAIKEVATKTSGGAKTSVNKAVRTVYAIPKSDMDLESKRAKVVANGKMRVGRYKVTNYDIKYDGRLLTPIHFNMSQLKSGTIKYTIKKGQRKAFKKRPAFLAPAAEGKTIIPFQRHAGENKYHPTRGYYKDKKYKRSGLPVQVERVEPIKTVSIPQMITNKEVADVYTEDIGNKLAKRIPHYLEREFDRSAKTVSKMPQFLLKNM